jgi:hypothetical protein
MCCEYHVAPTIPLCFGLVEPTIILNVVSEAIGIVGGQWTPQSTYTVLRVPKCLSPSLELGPPLPLSRKPVCPRPES